MGIRYFSSSTYDKPQIIYKEVPANPNPDPKNFLIKRALEIKPWLILEVVYPGCTNYEGRKILVYKAMFIDIVKQNNLDPHFSNNKKYHSPFARFVPTNEGWEAAISFCEGMNEKQ